MNEPRRHATGTAAYGGGHREAAVRAAKVRRTAWLLAALAVFFYFGFIAWNVLRTSGG